MNTREEKLEAAIRDLRSGVYPSQRAVAKAYGIPQSTLSTRLHGAQSSHLSHKYLQRLTTKQEEFLVQWIIEENARQFPLSYARTREMASRILKMNGDDTPVGKHWIHAFLKRNPRVASIVGRKKEAQRAERATSEQVRAFLELFEKTCLRLGIRAEDPWNMDETGKAMGVYSNSRVLADSGKRKAYFSSPGNRKWMSIIERVSVT